MADNLKQKMIGAVAWSSVDRFGQQTVQFMVGLLLARLLSPSDFGLVGMVMIFSALSFVMVESGFGQALVRKKDASEIDYNTIFYFNLGMSVFLYAILFISAPAIAAFFNQPRLVAIGRVIFLAILFNAFYLVPFVRLGKVLDFKTIAKVNLISTSLSGGAGVVLALLHVGVWALVAQQVVYHFMRMITFYAFVRWQPQRLFSFSVIQNFWRFSINLLGISALNVFFNYLYILLLSRFYPLQQVGYYSQANKLSETVNYSFQTILAGSTYALFAQIQEDDGRFRRIFREVAEKTSVVTFPVALVLMAVAHPLILVLLSSKWLPAVPYFQLLCLASLFMPLYTLNMNALNARGESRVTFRVELIKKVLIVITVLVAFRLGIIAMLLGYVLASFVSYLISMFYLKRNLGHYIKHQITAFMGSLGMGIFIAGCVYALAALIPDIYVRLGAQIILAAFLYSIGMKVFYRELLEKALRFAAVRAPRLFK